MVSRNGFENGVQSNNFKNVELCVRKLSFWNSLFSKSPFSKPCFFHNSTQITTWFQVFHTYLAIHAVIRTSLFCAKQYQIRANPISETFRTMKQEGGIFIPLPSWHAQLVHADWATYFFCHLDTRGWSHCGSHKKMVYFGTGSKIC